MEAKTDFFGPIIINEKLPQLLYGPPPIQVGPFLIPYLGFSFLKIVLPFTAVIVGILLIIKKVKKK